jgi:hypothetical protein
MEEDSESAKRTWLDTGKQASSKSPKTESYTHCFTRYYGVECTSTWTQITGFKKSPTSHADVAVQRELLRVRQWDGDDLPAKSTGHSSQNGRVRASPCIFLSEAQLGPSNQELTSYR